MYKSAIKKVARYHKQKWFHDPTNIFVMKLLYYEEKKAHTKRITTCKLIWSIFFNYPQKSTKLQLANNNTYAA